MQAKFLTPIVAALVLAPAGSAIAADPPAAAPVAAPAAAPAAPAAVMLSATLNGANEDGGKGDPDGSGTFTARVEKGKLCYTITSTKIDDPTMAHIHKGTAGASGAPYIGLEDIDPGEHCQDIDQDRLDAISSKPQDYYVNIHNGDYPGGAIRGQLTKQ